MKRTLQHQMMMMIFFNRRVRMKTHQPKTNK
jgi:hypothetical protein